MTAVFIFALVLLLAVLLSELAERSILSAAVLFLLAGFLTGGVLDLISLRPQNPVVSQLADLALFSILFTDGMRVGLEDLISAWHLPGRALILGLPLTLVGTALACRYLVGEPWLESLLVGAVLSPTDPVFASAIVGREEIPHRLRHLLNVESGLNDGLALPFVLILLTQITPQGVGIPAVLGQLALGLVLGVVIPWGAGRLEQSRFFAVAGKFQSLFVFAVGLLVLSTAWLTGANEYLAAFGAGVTLATLRPDLRDEFQRFGEHLAELFKLAAVLVFGALISPRFLAEVPWRGYLFAVVALVLVRPAALGLALLGTRLGWREQVAAYWFGPKGFASVVYGLLVLKAGVPHAEYLFHLIALVIAASIVAHSSTDVVVARWFHQKLPAPER